MVCRRAGPPPGCVIASDLFNIFFVAVLTVAFDRFSIDKAVLDDFVRVVARGDLTKDAAKRVLWAMLYADDAGIASQSQASLEKIMTAIVEVCAAFGLIVSEKKTVTMHMRPPTMRQKRLPWRPRGKGTAKSTPSCILAAPSAALGALALRSNARLATPGTASSSTAGRCTTTHTSQWQTRSVS